MFNVVGQCQEFLPFDQYGELIQMDISPDGMQVVMLLSSREEQYIAVMDTGTGKMAELIYHNGCHEFVISDNRFYLATAATNHDGEREVKLWSLPNGQELFHIDGGSDPVFVGGSNMFLCIVDAESLLTYSTYYFLKDSIDTGLINKIQAVPRHEEQVLLTTFNILHDHPAKVRLLDLKTSEVVITFKDVSPNGLLDFSKDGRFGVDGYLNVFDMKTGQILVRIKGERISNESSFVEPLRHVKMTYDGKYVIWVESLTIRVCRIRDCQVIARTSTHESVTYMEVLDYGYYIVIGREDGHVICMKLVDPDVSSPLEGNFDTNMERTAAIVEHLPVESKEDYDPIHQVEPAITCDTDLPRMPPGAAVTLTEKVKVPHAVLFPRLRSLSDCESPSGSHPGSRPGSPVATVQKREVSPRSSLHDLLSPTAILRNTSSFFLSLGSQENLSEGH